MAAISSRPSSPNVDSEQLLDALIAQLLEQPETEQVGSELEVLKSIYGDHAIRVWQAGDLYRGLRFEVELDFPSPYEEVTIKVLISLPSTYPAESPPQLQLLSRYIGAFSVDSDLFGSILRTFISSTGVEWTQDTVCVFDGLQDVLDRCVKWYEERLSAEKAGQLIFEDARETSHAGSTESRRPDAQPPTESVQDLSVDTALPAELPAGIQIFEAEPILDRKSSFVGRACAISDPAQVPVILMHLSSDRRISRAAHPIINAWRCQVGNILHQDNDDDGETAAGGRLAHLLQILDLDNVLVVVTRYYGGIHLGPDRFKHINQAARNALDIGGFLDSNEDRKTNARGRKKR